jgi:hypothetical protein
MPAWRIVAGAAGTVADSLAWGRTVAPSCTAAVGQHGTAWVTGWLPQVGTQQGLVNGLCLGGLNVVLFAAYSGSLFYGAVRVAAGGMTPGGVLAVMMSALLGSFSLGQVSGPASSDLTGRDSTTRDSTSLQVTKQCSDEEVASGMCCRYVTIRHSYTWSFL